MIKDKMYIISLIKEIKELNIIKKNTNDVITLDLLDIIGQFNDSHILSEGQVDYIESVIYSHKIKLDDLNNVFNDIYNF